MPRVKENAVHNFFSYDRTARISTCFVCKNKMKGNHASNLLHHMAAKHKEEYKIIEQKNCTLKETKHKNSRKSHETQNDIYCSDSSEINSLLEVDHSAVLDVDLLSNISEDNKSPSDCSNHNNLDRTINKIRQHCIDLVIVHGRPFSLFDDEAFKNILQLIKIPPEELQTINSYCIKNLVIKAAKEKREEIASEWKDKLVCIKVDSITHQNRLFLGINAQFVVNSQIVIRNLGITEVPAPYNHDNQKDKLLQIINKYNLNMDQVYTITTNDRKIDHNLLKDGGNDDENKMNVNKELEQILGQDLLSISTEHLTTRCAANSLELAIHDALREYKDHSILEAARNIVRKMESDTELLTANKTPTLDISTHWRSTFEMLEDLIELRENFTTNPGFIPIPEKTWEAFNDIIKALTPAANLAKNIELENYTVGDFFYNWTKCHLATEKIGGNLARLVCEHMNEYKKHLMRNETFLSALYLDPRFQVVLSAEEMSVAVEHLKAAWLKLLNVEAKTRGEPLVEIKKDPDDEMEVFLALTESEKRQDHETYYIQSQANIGDLLINFSRHTRINAKDNILRFWQDKKATDPQLSRLANTVLATPTTHNVNCLLSSLKFLLSSLRYNFCDEIVEDIMVLRNN